MIVIGIDPSSIRTGYGVIEYRGRERRYVACGCITPGREQAFEDRLVYMFERLREIVIEQEPAEAAVESTFFGRDAAAAAKLGQARGVLILALRLAGTPIWHYSPAEVKRAITGHGQASKKQVQFVTAKLLGLSALPTPMDASDALAISLCHTFRSDVVPHDRSSGRSPEVDDLLRRMIRR